MKDVVVPKWGLSMDDAVLTHWHVAVGDTIELDAALADIETDKADGEVPSPVGGRVAELLVEPGATVEPGQTIARIDESA